MMIQELGGKFEAVTTQENGGRIDTFPHSHLSYYLFYPDVFVHGSVPIFLCMMQKVKLFKAAQGHLPFFFFHRNTTEWSGQVSGVT